MMITEKRPRHYAADIVALPTAEQQKAAFNRVPKEWQALTRKHIEITYFINKHRK